MSAGFSGLDSGLPSLPLAANDCWNRIGTTGDRSCPELETHIHETFPEIAWCFIEPDDKD